MNRIKLLIAENSPLFKKMFAKTAMEWNENTSVSYASDCGEALEHIRNNIYDVIVIDTEISGMNMAIFFRDVMTETPKALVLATAQPSSVSDKLCAEAMASGAFNFMVKPIYDSYDENCKFVKRRLFEVFKVVCDERSNKNKPAAAEPAPCIRTTVKKSFCPEIVLFAVSTGGPMALENILSKLPENFPVPIIIVQHMPAAFIETLVHHLNQKSRLHVKIAENREVVKSGFVYIAAGGIHTMLDGKNRIRLDDSPPINGVRPSADILFKSVAESFGGSGVLAVILTGMGNDGEKGLEALKEKQNCFCLVQSEKTCVVYGMPRAAADAGFADMILDLDRIPAEIESFNYKSDINPGEKGAVN